MVGALLGMVGALMINVGKGIQKQKVHVFKQGRQMFRPPHRADLGVWLLGMLSTAVAVVTTLKAPPFALILRFPPS